MVHHEYRPAEYHNTLGPHEPVLWIQSGDRITTETVDARGFDHSRVLIVCRNCSCHWTRCWAVLELLPAEVRQSQRRRLAPMGETWTIGGVEPERS